MSAHRAEAASAGTEAWTAFSRKYAILYVDDEEAARNSFSRAFGEEFRVITAADAQEGVAVLERQGGEVGLLMTDQRMPGEPGVWLLEKARQLQPQIIRMLAIGRADMDAVIAAVNSGAIYKCVVKPWDPTQLESVLKCGLELFSLQRERDELLRGRMSALGNTINSDRMVSLGLLASGLSHHIRNSLVAMKTFLDLVPVKMAEEELDLAALHNPGFWKEYYQKVQGEIFKINTMLSDLLEASEKRPARFADQVQLHQATAETISRLQPALAARKIQVENQIPQWLPLLQADRVQIHRLFELLLKEEIASLPLGSRITLRAHLECEGPSDLQAIQVQLHDDGPGLSEEALRLVFDPFLVRSGSPLEFGIHLMACYFIVQSHAGRIEARSQAGQGATFTLWLPLNPEPTLACDNEDLFLNRVRRNDRLLQKLISGP